MKLNRNRRPTTISKKDIVPSPDQVREEIERQSKLKQEKDKSNHREPQNEYFEELKKEEVKKDEPKIGEYEKEQYNSRKRISSTPKIRTDKKVIIHKPILFIFTLIIILGGVYLGGNIFHRANINITSKHQEIDYNNKQFTAGKSESANDVDFEIMITPSKKSVNIVLTEPKEVSIKGEGSITLYNEFSTKAEKISAGTFISDEEGKTYKTNNTVSIPGYKTENKKIIPGQIAVKITSFLPGDAYNGSPNNFHINSFKGTTKYNKIYGKLKTPIVGGASGLVYTLDDKSKSNLNNIANTSFKDELLTKVKTLVPPGYIVYPNALTFSYDNVENILSKTPETSIEINGTLSVILLKEKSLVENIIRISLPNIKDEEEKEIRILDLDKLTFGFVDKNQVITKDMDTIHFTLSGKVDAVWYPDIELLKTKLLGIYKNDVLSIFRQDPGISSALVKIFPPWQKYIPDNPLKINIITE